MKKIFILILILFSTSCSSNTKNISSYRIDPEFNPYIDEYKNIINSKFTDNKELYDYRLDKLKINFAKLDDKVMGECSWNFFVDRSIEINKKHWQNATFIGKKFLIYHELEHCVRYRSHTHTKKENTDFWDYIEELAQKLGIIDKKGFFEDGCPDSIMYPYDTSEYCNEAHYNEYIEEMANYK